MKANESANDSKFLSTLIFCMAPIRATLKNAKDSKEDFTGNVGYRLQRLFYQFSKNWGGTLQESRQAQKK
jgi:hypothetical protein